MNFYFTFGTGEEYPFYGGWVQIKAYNADEACDKFRARFPDHETGFLNCAFVYTEEEFKKTGMAEKGNFGFLCHELIE